MKKLPCLTSSPTLLLQRREQQTPALKGANATSRFTSYNI